MHVILKSLTHRFTITYCNSEVETMATFSFGKKRLENSNSGQNVDRLKVLHNIRKNEKSGTWKVLTKILLCQL